MFGVVAWPRGVKAMGPSLWVAERGDERGAVSGIVVERGRREGGAWPVFTYICM